MLRQKKLHTAHSSGLGMPLSATY